LGTGHIKNTHVIIGIRLTINHPVDAFKLDKVNNNIPVIVIPIAPINISGHSLNIPNISVDLLVLAGTKLPFT